MKYKSNNSLIGIVYINAKKYKQGHGIIKIGYWCRREIREKTNHKTENQRYYIYDKWCGSYQLSIEWSIYFDQYILWNYN
jgi:hypothetical protein